MRKLPEEHPLIYHHFIEGKFVAKTSTGFFKAVGADMKLEQTIQRAVKDVSDVIGKQRQIMLLNGT